MPDQPRDTAPAVSRHHRFDSDPYGAIWMSKQDPREHQVTVRQAAPESRFTATMYNDSRKI